MKILLARTRYTLPEFYLPRFINEPLGLEYLAAAVRDKHEVQIFDSIANGWNKYARVQGNKDFFYQGAELNKLQKKISEFKPDVVGISWIFSVQKKTAQETINFIKQNNKDLKIIVGGSHVSVNPEKILEENPGIDIVVYGEGEITLKELLDKNLNNLETIDGIAFRKSSSLPYKDEEIIKNPPRALVKEIDNILPPLRSAVPYKNYSKQMLYVYLVNRFKKYKLFSKDSQRKLAYMLSKTPYLEHPYYKIYNRRHEHDLHLPEGDIMTSRGCPNNCVFCAVHTLWKHTWRAHSVTRVLSEIDELAVKYKIKRINIQDDNFNISKERIIKICEEVVKNKYDITFSASGTYAPALDENVLTWLQKAGFRNIRLSIESGNQEILDKVIRKRIDLKTIPEIVKMAKKRGIIVEGAFILGLPGETKETMRDSVNFAKKVGFDVIKYFIYQPFPNTEAYDICKEKGYITEGYDEENIFITGANAYVKTEDFTPEDVLSIARELDK